MNKGEDAVFTELMECAVNAALIEYVKSANKFIFEERGMLFGFRAQNPGAAINLYAGEFVGYIAEKTELTVEEVKGIIGSLTADKVIHTFPTCVWISIYRRR
jgi:hypothetical protein